MILSSIVNAQNFHDDSLISHAFSSFTVDLDYHRRMNVVLDSIIVTELNNRNSIYLKDQAYNLLFKLLESGDNDLALALALELDLI